MEKTIIVNAQEKSFPENTILSYEDIVRLAHGEEADVEKVWTISWRNKEGGAGTLIKGQRLGLSGNGLVINCMDTSNA
jgi:hypothetical protein